MRRRFAMAVGGCLAVAAVGTAQQAIMSQQPAPVQQVQATSPQYRSPFLVSSQPVSTAVAPQPTAMQQVQYIPVQPIQTYSLPAPQALATSAPQMSTQPITELPAAPSATIMVAPTTVQSNSPSIQYFSMQPVPAPPPAPARPITMPQPNQPQMIPAPAGSAAPLAANNNGAAIVGNSCSNGNCLTCEPRCCTPCGPCGQLWASVEYLLWWPEGSATPALVTGSPLGTPRTQAGVLGQPGTFVRLGNEDLGDEDRSGFRLRVGGWLDECRLCGLEASYFLLNDIQHEGVLGGGVTARPFTNSNTGQPDSQLTNYPGVVDGFAQTSYSNRFTGFDVNFRKNLRCDCCCRTDFLVGFRYLNLEDELSVREVLTVTGTDPTLNPPPGTQIVLADQFKTQNEFYGPQVGLTGEMRRGAFYVDWRTLIAFGTTHKNVSIEGETTITPPGGTPTTYNGGLLALPTNIGHYSKNDFAVVPEVNINVGYQVTNHARVFVGYTFLYWSNVTRPGDVIDTTINPTQLPPGTLVGPARPAFAWHDSDFWVHGVSFGAELRY